jgi:radical SAM protein with 4Fe4S-binding SPASM domain
MQTGGLHLTEERIREAAEAGLQGVGVSIDGLEEVHDRLRGVKGSFVAAFAALRRLRDYGITTSVNTQITSLVIPQLHKLFKLFLDAGAKNWQVQLTVAMGRAADHPEILLQPYELLDLMPLLAELYEKGVDQGLLLQPGNNIGYFGPYESLLRGSGDDRIHWKGCRAGQNTIGIEADGTIKGCPSLATSVFAGGNIRDLSLEDIWRKTPELNFNHIRTGTELSGFCRTCYYAEVCRGGCTWLTHSLFGDLGNNPYCHHRTLELARRGLRERIELIENAPGIPFDHGLFALILETLDGQPLEETKIIISKSNIDGLKGANTNHHNDSVKQLPRRLVQIESSKKQLQQPSFKQRHRTARFLILCRNCNRHIYRRTSICTHCGGNVKAAAQRYGKKLRAARRACQRLLKHLPQT